MSTTAAVAGWNKYYFDYCLNTQCICEHWSEQEMISFDATSTTTINLQHSLCNILGIDCLANIYVICNFIMMLMLHEFGLFWTVTVDCVSLLYFTSVIRVGGIMVNVLALSGVDSGFEPDRIKPKTITIYICFFFTNNAVLSNKSKIWHVRNYDNVSEWSDIWTNCCFSEKTL